MLKEIGTKGITYTAKDFENFVHTYDKNADGKIDYEVLICFICLYSNVRCIIEILNVILTWRDGYLNG